jgi:isopropylmalate/homocitrate/citramalate synthase
MEPSAVISYWDDKIKIAQRLDELGMHYIRMLARSNPKDAAFFLRVSPTKAPECQNRCFRIDV